MSRSDGRDAGVTGARRGGNDAGEHGGHHRDLHTLLGFDAAGKVALRQVRQFVGHDRGVFRFAAGIQKEAAVDSDNPAGSGKGVELRAVEEDELQAAILQLACFGQAIDAGFDEVLEQRIRQLGDLSAQHAQPGAAQLVFLLWGDDRGAGVAQRRQIACRQCRTGEQAGEGQQGGAQQFHPWATRQAKVPTLSGWPCRWPVRRGLVKLRARLEIADE